MMSEDYVININYPWIYEWLHRPSPI